MIERIKNILSSPKSEWEKIKAETETMAQVLMGYAVPLGLIPTVCGFLGYTLIGVSRGIFSPFRYPFVSGLIWAIMWYILTLVGLFVGGLVINSLAPSFDSKQNSVNAFKLVVYSTTPYFIAGILYIFPLIGILVMLISLYGLYLLYTGLPVMMETPKEKVIGYLVLSIIVMIVVNIIVGAIAHGVMSLTWRPPLRLPLQPPY